MAGTLLGEKVSELVGCFPASVLKARHVPACSQTLGAS